MNKDPSYKGKRIELREVGILGIKAEYSFKRDNRELTGRFMTKYMAFHDTNSTFNFKFIYI